MGKITVTTTVNKPVREVWKKFTTAEDIEQWNAASPDWHTPSATLDLEEGGSFNYRMEARDGSFGFDMAGIFDEIVLEKRIAYSMADGRKTEVVFTEDNGATTVTETFDAETQNPEEMQRQGWQAILDNFKKYTEES